MRVDPGVLLGELDAANQAHGRAVPAGIVTHTGIAGLSLGGGIGWLMRRFGLTADSLIEADVVLADGTMLRASEDEHPDLLWGLRGGGGNFGVVTSFTSRAHPVGPTVLAGPMLFPLDRTQEVMDVYGGWSEAAPRELTTILNFRGAPPAPWVPDELHGTPGLVVGVLLVRRSRGRGARPGADPGARPARRACAPRPFVELQGLFDAAVQPGWHYYWKSSEVAEVSADLVGAIVDATEGRTSPRSYTIVFQLGGAISDVPEGGSAYPHRAAGFDVNVNAVWLPEEADAASEHVGWARSLFAEIEPAARGRTSTSWAPRARTGCARPTAPRSTRRSRR